MNNLEKELISYIREGIKEHPNPALYLSGGLDSSIVLYHLVEKGIKVNTYTADFEYGNGNTIKQAKKVAEWFGVENTVVKVDNFIEKLPEILIHFDRPRYNVWVYYLAEAANKDNIKTVYVGEGGDENFGYKDRGYLTGWASQIAYVMPTYDYIHKIFNLKLEAPLYELPWKKFLNYWHPEKKIVRDAYRGLLPDFIIDAPSAPPEFVDYFALWKQHLSKYYPKFVPKDKKDIRYILQLLVAKIWVEVHEGKIT